MSAPMQTERMLCCEAKVVSWYADGDTYYEPEKGVEFNFTNEVGGYEEYVYSVRAEVGTYAVGLYYEVTFTERPEIQRPPVMVRQFVSARAGEPQLPEPKSSHMRSERRENML